VQPEIHVRQPYAGQNTFDASRLPHPSNEHCTFDQDLGADQNQAQTAKRLRDAAEHPADDSAARITPTAMVSILVPMAVISNRPNG
jgi:hypothetical protein